MDNGIFSKVDNYIDTLFNKRQEALAKAEASIEASGIPAISVTANQGKFLHMLAKICSAKKILEIGTLGGYSTIWMASALPADGKLISLELDPYHASVAQKNVAEAGLEAIVDIRVGSAIELLPGLEKEDIAPFDMIFIDADKPPYTEYFQWALKLSRPGTLIIADNVIRDGKVLDQNNTDPVVNGVQRFNKVLAGTAAVTATILQLVGVKEHDGMALAIVN